MQHTLGQRLIAEFVGTFALIFIGAGSIVATQQIIGTGPGEAGQLLAIAIAHGLVIAVMVSALGHVSGGHFNPAVTIGAAATRKIPGSEAGAYIATQLVGGIVGAAVLKLVVPEKAFEAVAGGTPLVVPQVDAWQAVLIELVLTFFLVWVIFGTAIDPKGSFDKIAGLAIGFTIMLDILMGGPWTGASMNPARTFGPGLVSGNWAGWWIYWIGPIAGALLAALLYDRVILPGRRDTPAAPPSAEPGIN